VSDLSAKRQLNQGFGNALSVAVELTVTPVLMALIGYGIDRWLGTFPLVFLVLFAFTLGYLSWKQYVLYRGRMEAEEQQLLGGRRSGGTR